MFISKLTIENFRCYGDGEKRFELPLRPGLNALVGANDCGKSAVIDAIRFALGTVDQEWYRLEDTDFHQKNETKEIKIKCKFEFTDDIELKPFIEYLTYPQEPGKNPVMYVNWFAKNTGDVKRGRNFRRVEVCSGINGDGPSMAPEAREILRATYLRPLRDAEKALTAGRGSRLSQILNSTDLIKEPIIDFGPDSDLNILKIEDIQQFNVLQIAYLIDQLLENQSGVTDARKRINQHLETLVLGGETICSNIDVSGSTASEEQRLRQMLEKLDLSLEGNGKPGLGSNNLLYIACELLLLSSDNIGNNLLLVEEPEGHLHPQRQLQVMKFLQNQAKENNIQVIITTHSPNLASVIDLDNMTIIHDFHPYSLQKGLTKLEETDYSFLQRFLDVTKANLFFAQGVLIVEGIAENILLPALATIIGRDLTKHGVSIVNVGGVGLRRYARIFQRENKDEKEGEDVKLPLLKIPVACITDMDVMPDCAPIILGKVKDGEDWPDQNQRRWKAKQDFSTDSDLAKERQIKEAKASGQYVRTFVSDEWTLEYDLALGPKKQNGNFSGVLCEEMFIAAYLAKNDDAINEEAKNSKEKKIKEETAKAKEEFTQLKQTQNATLGCSKEEVLATKVYKMFAVDHVSKSIAAQYLAQNLQTKFEKKEISSKDLRNHLPTYLVNAIDYVTGNDASPENEEQGEINE